MASILNNQLKRPRDLEMCASDTSADISLRCSTEPKAEETPQSHHVCVVPGLCPCRAPTVLPHERRALASTAALGAIPSVLEVAGREGMPPGRSPWWGQYLRAEGQLWVL